MTDETPKNQSLTTIFLIIFIDLLGFGLILPLLPYIAERFSANPFEIGLLTAVYSFFQFLATPVLGRLSDRYGRKKLLIISQLGTMVGFLILGFANTLTLLFVSRIIDGITGGNISIAQAYIADVTDAKSRAKGMGIIGAAFGLGFIMGPVIGGILSQFGFIYPAMFAAMLSLITALTTAIFLTESVNTKSTANSTKTAFSWQEMIKVVTAKPMFLFIVTFFLINLAFSGMQGTYALWTERTFGWGPQAVGYVFAYIGILSVIMQLKILPIFTAKFGERKTLLFAVPMMGLGLVLIPFAFHIGILLVANALMVLGNSLSNPTLQSLATENVPPEDYGGTLGLLQSAGSLGRIFGPIIGGELFYILSKDAPYITGALIIFLTGLILKKGLTVKNIKSV